MKPEFSEVLLPPSEKNPVFTTTVPSSARIYPSKTPTPSMSLCCLSKWLGLIIALIGVFFLTILMTGLVLRYENKLAQYETRISLLEDELGLFLQQFETARPVAESVLEASDDDFLMNEDDDNSSSYEEDEVEEILFPDIIGLRGNNAPDDKEDIGKIVFGELTTKPLSRQRRQIPQSQIPVIAPNVERTRSGVPVLEGSYSSRPAGGHGFAHAFEQHPTEGLRIYESLITTGGQGEPKAPEYAESEGTNVQDYHHRSAAWTDGPTERPSRLEVKSGGASQRIAGGPGSGASSSYRQLGSSHHGRELESGTGTGPNVIIRSSRVPSTSEFLYPTRTQSSSYQYPPLKRIGQGDGEVIARVHQEEVSDQQRPDHAIAGATHGETASAHAESRTYKAGYRTRGRQQSTDEQSRRRATRLHNRKEETHSDEVSFVTAEAWTEGPRTIAAHYVSDSSNYSLTHRHYEGNGRLKNADGVFASWKPAAWMESNEGLKSAFDLSSTGVLTVKKEGIYYIYAQVHYLDDHDVNSFMVQINSAPFLQCTRMTETTSSSKSNTCFTAGLNYLKENDRIVIRDIETNRFSIIKPEKTFFGLMRIGDSLGK